MKSIRPSQTRPAPGRSYNGLLSRLQSEQEAGDAQVFEASPIRERGRMSCLARPWVILPISLSLWAILLGAAHLMMRLG